MLTQNLTPKHPESRMTTMGEITLGDVRTTGEVVDHLNRLHLNVTLANIADDTEAHYLAPRETEYRGRDGVSGLWEPWMERRAERLYRLRALHRRIGRGPSGNVLRLLLFFADGWGWEYVKETCIQGYRVSLRAVKRGVANRVRRQPLTITNLQTFADDIAAEQYRPQDPTQAQIDRVKMTIGLVMLGAAPDAKIGTLDQIMDTLFPELDPNDTREHKPLAPLAWTLLAVSESEGLKTLEFEVDAALIQKALAHFRFFVWRIRYALNKKVEWRRNEKRPSLNPLTGFGATIDPRFRQALRNQPIRATPAQYLGGQFAHSLVIAYGQEQEKKAFEFMLKWIAWWLQSADCAQWLQRLESEESKAP
jgi:hypothetical protein